MSARAADDFVAIRTRMVELRQKPAEVRAREAVRHGAAKEHYPQQLMGTLPGDCMRWRCAKRAP